MKKMKDDRLYVSFLTKEIANEIISKFNITKQPVVKQPKKKEKTNKEK